MVELQKKNEKKKHVWPGLDCEIGSHLGPTCTPNQHAPTDLNRVWFYNGGNRVFV